jgi:hypothetical protein
LGLRTSAAYGIAAVAGFRFAEFWIFLDIANLP